MEDYGLQLKETKSKHYKNSLFCEEGQTVLLKPEIKEIILLKSLSKSITILTNDDEIQHEIER